MTKEDALKKVHHGSIVVYEGTDTINVGYVQSISENGTIEVYDIVDGKVGAGGEYHRTPEEYFLYKPEPDDYYLINQEKRYNRKPTKEEFFWFKLCQQNARLRDKYSIELINYKERFNIYRKTTEGK